MNITREKFKSDVLEFINQSNGLRYSEFEEIAKHPPPEYPDIFKEFSMHDIIDEIISDDMVVVVEYRVPRDNDIWYKDRLILPKGSRVISIEDSANDGHTDLDIEDWD